MATPLYIEVNAICLFILALILQKLHKIVNARAIDKSLFMLALLCAILLYAANVLWLLVENGMLRMSRQCNAWVNAWYLSQAGVLSFAWFLFVDCRLGSHIRRNRKRLLLCALPLLLLFALSVSSIWTRWLFYIDENNVYHRGRFFSVQLALGYGYMLWAAARALFWALREKNYIRKRGYYTLASFVILPLLCGVLQTVYYGLPALCAGVTLSLLMVFITYLERQISLDSLTQLNNRNQLEKHLAAKLGDAHDKHKLYLLMMDVDFFKRINDGYGHLEGDAALLRVAGALKQACGTRNCFIARYGGDEFVIVFSCEAEAEAERLQQAITAALQAANAAAGTPYTLTLSIGCAQYTAQMESMQQFLAAADAKLYAVKQARHRQAG